MLQLQLLWIYTVLVPCIAQTPMFMQPPVMMEGELAAVLDATPVTVTAEAGTDAQLSCYVTNLGENAVTWFDNNYVPLALYGDVAAQQNRLSIESPYDGEYILTIRNVRADDAGTYICMLQVFPPQTKYVELEVKARPSIVSSSLADTAVVEGRGLEKVCQASGAPPPTIRWYAIHRDPDTFQDTRELHSDGGTLEVRSVQKSDRGRYLCIAQNEHGTDEHEIYIDVFYAPRVQSSVREVTVTRGDSATLECSVDMNPMGDLHWMRNDNTLLNTWKYSLAMYNDSNRLFLTLTVRQVEASDTGIYMCVARNLAGMDRLRAQIHVFEPTTTPEPTVPPVIDTSRLKSNYIFIEEDRVNVTCRVSGRPRPRVTWMKYVGDILALFLEGERLEIESVQRTDRGLYMCEAVHDQWKVSHSVNIDIHYPPTVTTTVASLEVTEGATITLQCTAASNPASQIVWKFNSLTMSNSWKVKEHLYTDSGNTTESSLHLTIKQVDLSNAGEYVCVAVNYLGESSLVVPVAVIETTTEVSPSSRTTLTTVIAPEKMVTGTDPRQTLGPKTGASSTNPAVTHRHLAITNILLLVFIFMATQCLS